MWLLTMEKYQNILVKRVAKYLSEKLHTKVEIAHVKFSFFNNFNVEGVYIEDNKRDTLAYIGHLQINSTDLLSAYWNEKTIIVHRLDVENAFVYLNRRKDSSAWNFDFIANAFSSKSADSNSAKLPTKKEVVAEKSTAKAPLLDLKQLACKNVKFIMDDAWGGQDLRFAVEDFDLQINEFDLEKKRIELGKINIDAAKILFKDYIGGKPEDNSPDDTTLWGTPFNPDLFSLALNELKLSNSSFTYQKGNVASKPNEFDETNLQLNQINLALSNTKIIADTIFADIRTLALNERCGLEIKNLSASLKLSQVQAQLSQMKLETKNSILQDHFEMNYLNFHDFNNFISGVNMQAHLENSNVSSIDIGYFANILNQYPIAIQVAGDVNGTVDNLAFENLNLNTRNTTFMGSGFIKGLPDVEHAFFNADVHRLISSGSDLNALIPQTRTDAVAWNELKKIEFEGTYFGKVADFHTKGNLKTSLGNAFVDLDLNLKPKNPEYSGEIRADNFFLGRLIKQSSIGHVSVSGNIQGSGFDINTLNSKLNAKVSNIEINGNNYQNLTINGIVSNKKFDGIFVSQDPNVAFNFNGVLDISGKEPALNLNSRIIRFDLQKLGLTSESTIVSCLASLNFKGNNIDNFFGEASLKNIVLHTKDKTLLVDSINLNSSIVNDEKLIQLKSSIADAELKGKFNISELANAWQLYLCHYLPHYIQKPRYTINEQFSYALQVKDASGLLNIFMPKLNEINGVTINGSLNTFEKKFSLDGYAPTIAYDNMKVRELYLVSAGDFSSFEMNVNSKDFIVNEESIIPSFQINGSMASDTAYVELNTQSIDDLFGNASVKVKGTAINDLFYVKVLPSNIKLKQDVWQLYCNEEMVIGDEIFVKGLVAESGAQKISISTEKGIKNNLIATVENMDLESISQYAGLVSPSYYGRLSGKIEVNDFMGDPFIQAKIKSVNEIRIDRDTVGIVTIEGGYDVNNKIISIDKSTSIDRNNNVSYVSGTVDLKDKTINVKATMKDAEISFVNQFVDDFIQNLHGKITGNVAVQGKLEEPKISGSLKLTDGGLKVLLLGTSYAINEANFKFNNQKIEMDDVVISDERNGNYTSVIRGEITHKNFSHFYLNLNLKSDDLLCLNTKEWDSDLFYGYVHAKVNVQITGDLNDLVMDIDAKPLLGSSFYLPLGGAGDASKFEYVRFRELGHSQQEENKKVNNYLKLTMNIEATPNIETIIVMDKNTGEQIVAKGNGDLKLVVDLGNAMEMYGNYVITTGKYLFKFRGVVNREFKIEEGSKITWTGDALAANMNVNAIYEVGKQLALYPLVSNVELDDVDKAEAKRTYKTLVPLSLTGSLSQPTIKFDIIQPDNKSLGSAGYTKLQQIRSDEKELFNQAGVLLLLGDFKASEGVTQQSYYSQGAVSTVSDLVSTAVSSEITNQFQNITGLKNISLGVNYQSLSNTALITNTNRNQFSFNVSANLLKDRVVVDFSNSVDVGKDATGNTTSNFNGDFKAQFLITNDGRFRANAYRTNNVDIGGSPYTRGGVGLSYKVVFNSFADLFQSKKKAKKVVESDTLKDLSKN